MSQDFWDRLSELEVKAIRGEITDDERAELQAMLASVFDSRTVAAQSYDAFANLIEMGWIPEESLAVCKWVMADLLTEMTPAEREARSKP